MEIKGHFVHVREALIVIVSVIWLTSFKSHTCFNYILTILQGISIYRINATNTRWNFNQWIFENEPKKQERGLAKQLVNYVRFELTGSTDTTTMLHTLISYVLPNYVLCCCVRSQCVKEFNESRLIHAAIYKSDSTSRRESRCFPPISR